MTHFKFQRLVTSYTNRQLAWFLLIIIMMINFGCAIQRPDSAGRVNGVYIKKADFMNSLRGHFTGFVLEKDRTPTEAEKRELFNKTWRDITIHVILKDYFRKYEIQATQQEVIDTLLSNIPESMQKAPIFQSNGEFDKVLYRQELLDNSSTKLDWLRRYYFDYYIPIAKLKKKLQIKSVISKSELSKLDKILNSSADIEWVVFDPGTTDVKVTQSEIENYYHGHMDDYQIKPYADFGWVSIPINLSNSDTYQAQTKIDSIYFQITNGASFADFVERFSQSQTAKSGGSLGFIKTEELPASVSKALEGVDKNQFTRPVKFPNSWVIYQLTERTKNLVQLNELVIKITPGEETKRNSKENAIRLRDLGLQLGLETAADELDLTYNKSGIVATDSLWLKDGDLSAYLIDRAFTQNKGAILEPVYSENMRAWIVATVIDVQPNSNKQLMDVSDEISAILFANKQRVIAMAEAENWALLSKDKQLEAINNQSLQTIRTPALVVTGSVMSVPVRSNFVKIITDFQQNKTQSPYQFGDKILLPVVTNVQNVNPPLFSQSDVRKYYFQYLNPVWFDQWLDGEIKKADLTIWGTYP